VFFNPHSPTQLIEGSFPSLILLHISVQDFQGRRNLAMLPSCSSLVLVVTFFALLAFVRASTTNYNPTGAGCVDPKGFVSCYQTQLDTASKCSGTCNATDAAGTQARNMCLTGCDGQLHAVSGQFLGSLF